MKKNVYLFELSDIFANQVYLPYSSGVVWSYCNSKKEVTDNYVLKDWFYYRQDIHKILSKIENPDVLGFSCFMWNWNLNCEIAKTVKEQYPDCLVVFGGQHQPMQDRNKGFFKDHPFVDIMVHHEGELSFYDILMEALKDSPEYSKVPGLSINAHGKVFKTPPRPRVKDIAEMPSPYLDGLFDELVANNDSGLAFNANIESARGCPFSCAFCEIGEKYYMKVKTSYEKTKREIDWISDNKIEYVTDANSNFGLKYEQDYDLALYVRDKKLATGYPEAYRVTWVKGRADKVLNIAKIFEEAGVQKGMTIALQSMKPEVLKAIKRKNVDGGKLQEFIEMYEGENIGSYVELIWGLPEETLESFKDGIIKIMDYGYHNYLDIHLMMLLPNAPIASPSYMEKYGIKTSTTQPRFSHRHIDGVLNDDTVEFVTSTNTLTQEEWIAGHQFRWLIIFGHYLGPLQFISRGLERIYNISFRQFYDDIMQFCIDFKHTVIGKEYNEIEKNLFKVLENKRFWGAVVPSAGDINWNVDEATCIKIADGRKQLFYDEIGEFLLEKYPHIKPEVLHDLISYQKSRLSDPNTLYPFAKSFNYNIHNVIEDGQQLSLSKSTILFDAKSYNSDMHNWAKEILWFGRRVGKYKTNAKVMENL
jgi:radical SAM superfamily enzyme YgiQ (UPF0313 family)